MSDETTGSRRIKSEVQNYLPRLRKQGDGSGAGNYHRNVKRVLENEWLPWLQKRSIYTFERLGVNDMEDFALKHLTQKVEDGEYSAATARKYYDHIAAFCGWAADRGYLTQNVARVERAVEALPSDQADGDHQQQIWSPKQRRAVVDYVNKRAYEAVEEKGADALREVRDRAFVATIAYSGVRGGEIVADRNDPRRNGIQWADIDFENHTIDVLDKGKQETREASLPSQAVTVLERFYELADPPSDQWRVFLTLHRPTLWAYARDMLAEDRGCDSFSDAPEDARDEINEYLESEVDDILSIFYERDTSPPSITTAGARSLMQTICSDANIPDLDDGEYLEPHGGRRGAGDTLVREKGFEAAQRLLRHQNPETTMKSYSHISASEVADDASDAFEQADQR